MDYIADDYFDAGVVEPFVAMQYMLSNKVTIERFDPPNMYTPFDYFSGVPLTKVRVHTNPEVDFKASDIDSDIGFMIGQYHNKPIDILRPEQASLDLLTDIISGVYKYLLNEQPELAYACTQSFMLMSRIAKDYLPYIGGSQSTYEVKAHGL